MLLVMVHWFLISVTYLRDFMASHFRCWIAISASLAETRWAKECLCLVDSAQKGFLLGASCLSVDCYGLCGALYPSGCRGCFSKGLLIFLSNLLSPTTSVAIPITFRSFFTRSFSMSYLALAVCGSCRLSISSMSIWVQSSCTSCPRSISIKNG